MNCNDLYEGKYKNGNPTYYVDKSCTISFTGHLKEYFKGKLSRECDIVNGFMEGIEKIYYDFEGCLEMYREVNENRNNGLSIEYYRNGQIMNIATAIDEYYIIDFYSYTEQGKQQEIWILEEGEQWQHHCYYYTEDGKVRETWKRADAGLIPMNYAANKERIVQIRKRCQLEKKNKEILFCSKKVIQT
jgi:antitoxin component YwqK of YwqJK toxin-antitoxin module